MALLSRQDIIEALTELGQLALQQGMRVELVVVGGAAMILAFDARLSTRDVDALIVRPREARIVREFVKQIASARDWPDDWLNDGAKGYLVGLSEGVEVFSAPGILVKRPDVAQLLAMKLSAWRDDVDVNDARRLLREMTGSKEHVWEAVEPYLVKGDELKAQFAFEDLWEEHHDSN